MVHAGDVQFRRLLYNTPVLRIDIFGSDLDRSPFPESAASYDCPRHIAISEHFKDIQLDPVGPACVHFYIRVVNSSWHYSLGELACPPDLPPQKSSITTVICVSVGEFWRSPRF